MLRVRSDRLTWRSVGGEVIALDLETSTYFSTNRSGAVLWTELVEGRTHAQLVDTLRRRFEITFERAAADVDEFLAGLAANGLLEQPRRHAAG